MSESPPIIPRWEWRAFGSNFGPAEDRISAGSEPSIAETDEIYFAPTPANPERIVKMRFDLMDIKVLKEVNADGLEQWTPVMKAEFPLSQGDIARVFELLAQDAPSLARGTYTIDQFTDEVAAPAGIRSVRIHKRRARYTIGGCSAELSDVDADGHQTRTIAVESEDPAAVTAVVNDLGLGGYTNMSYSRGLTYLLDGLPLRYAVIDVGTNSVKFHVGERAAGKWRTIADRAEMTRLGEGLDQTGEISPEPLARTAEAIAGMVAEARQIGAVAIVAVGTAALRSARNSDTAISTIRDQAGFTVEVISGEEEGRLAYLAVLSELGLADQSLVVFDTGGGSSQFTFGRGDRVDERFSVDVGAVRLTERFGLNGVVSTEVLDEAIAAISDGLSRIDGRDPPHALVGMGGAITNITAVKLGFATYDPDAVQGAVLDITEIDRQIELYRTQDASARRNIVGLQPNRAEVILAGACIVRTIMQKLGQQSLTVSDRGLRHGLLVERFGR